MSNTFGQWFRVTTFGESHGGASGCVIDGCPARLPLTVADLLPQLARRRPGTSSLVSPRPEADTPEILSGVKNGLTLGTPIAIRIPNTATRPADYANTAAIPRPSHADFTTLAKYGIAPASGGGRASARETAARVAAGAVAEKLLSICVPGLDIVAWVEAIGPITAPRPDTARLSRAEVDSTPVRCPDVSSATRMADAIEAARADGDSLGGVMACVCRGVPAGWGEPVFDKLTATLAHAMMSIPAARGFDVGMGFASATLRGSAHNDPFEPAPGGGIRPASNRAGGIQGGISNGLPIEFRVAFKPVASIAAPQATVDYTGHPVTLRLRGRHDPCVLPRAVPVVEAMAALALADAFLCRQAQQPPALLGGSLK